MAPAIFCRKKGRMFRTASGRDKSNLWGGLFVKHRNNHLLVGYWQRLRQSRDVPDQTDIDPRAIKRVLSHVFILDASNPERPVYRLAGTSHCDQYGRELKGTNFLDRWERQSRGAIVSLLRQSLRMKRPLCLSSIGGGSSTGMTELESVLTPVTFIGDAPTRFVGMSQILGETSAAFANPITFERLVGSMLMSEDAAEWPIEPPLPAKKQTLKAPHLRLVVDCERPNPAHFEMNPVVRRVMAALKSG